jgi:hypothetical protein
VPPNRPQISPLLGHPQSNVLAKGYVSVVGPSFNGSGLKRIHQFFLGF